MIPSPSVMTEGFSAWAGHSFPANTLSGDSISYSTPCFLAPASQALLYTRPSEPHTGFHSASHMIPSSSVMTEGFSVSAGHSFPGVTLSGDSISYSTSCFLAPASQALLYTRPSEPHTGFHSVMHMIPSSSVMTEGFSASAGHSFPGDTLSG